MKVCAKEAKELLPVGQRNEATALSNEMEQSVGEICGETVRRAWKSLSASMEVEAWLELLSRLIETPVAYNRARHSEGRYLANLAHFST